MKNWAPSKKKSNFKMRTALNIRHFKKFKANKLQSNDMTHF